MYSRHSLSLLTTAVALALPFAAHAQNATDLDEVVVTGTRTDVALQDSLAPTQLITREEIERSQSRSLVDLLKGRAGIGFTNQGGLGKLSSLNIRGTESDHVLVLADGPGQRLDAARVAAEVSDTPWQPLMLAVDVRGGTVRNTTEGSTARP